MALQITEVIEREFEVKPLTPLPKYSFADEFELQKILNKYYYCYRCKKITLGHAVLEELSEFGFIKRKLFLECGHNYLFAEPIGYVAEYKTIIQIFVKVETYTPDKRLIRRLYQRSHSFLKQIIDLLYAMNNVAPPSTLTSGASGNIYNIGVLGPYINLYDTFGANALAGDHSYGIVVGSGTTANSTSTYALASLITNGTGTGQLQYGAMSISTVSVSGNTMSFNLSRTFTNGSSGTVNVNEIGIYNRNGGLSGSTVSYTYFASARDVLSATQAVAPNNSLTVTYTISITVS
jgi:hypothetical protein